MLIKRVYEIDPLICPHCGSQMKLVAFIEPPEDEVVEKILRGHQSTTGRRWFGPRARFPFFRPTPRTDLRGHGHVPGHLIIITDADDTDSDGNNPGNWDFGNGFDLDPYGFALSQLCVEMARGDFSVKVGHFFRVTRYERVTSPDNFFYSRSKALDWCEPRTHTGALGTYALSDNTNIYAGWTLG